MYSRKMILVLTILLCLALTLTLAACGRSLPSNSSVQNQTVSDANSTSNGQPSTDAASPDSDDKTYYLTLYADFSGSSTSEPGNLDDHIRDIKVGPLPIENEPASPSLIAFYLADELSAWTGLDFTLNDVRFDEDSITVDWSKNSTLISGLDDREQKDDFHFYDAVSLNWFMMDSLAMTLKNNLSITTVYYCSDGQPITFPNPEDMAAQGLSELAVDQPYEGSAFFRAHAGGKGE